MASYRLVNLHAASLVGTYATEDEALAAVALSVLQNTGEPECAKHIALQLHVPGQSDQPLDFGEALAGRALEAFASPEPA